MITKEYQFGCVSRFGQVFTALNLAAATLGLPSAPVLSRGFETRRARGARNIFVRLVLARFMVRRDSMDWARNWRQLRYPDWQTA
jgi:hypothetical protein